MEATMANSLTPEEWRGIESKQRAAEGFIDNPSRETLHDALSELWLIQRSINNIDYFLDENFLAEQSPSEIASTLDKARTTGNPDPVRSLDGFGWATATEILSALAPAKFALLNSRSTKAMDDLGNYDVPHHKSANLSQYEQFCNDIKDATTRYPLRELAAEIQGESAPEGTPDYLIADLCFTAHYNDDSKIDLTELEEDPLSVLTEYEILSEEFHAEISDAVAECSLYEDNEEFLRAAIRNEVRQL